jgi:hypothetical protein
LRHFGLERCRWGTRCQYADRDVNIWGATSKRAQERFPVYASAHGGVDCKCVGADNRVVETSDFEASASTADANSTSRGPDHERADALRGRANCRCHQRGAVETL